MALIRSNDRKPVIDLRGPAGNVFCVIGQARSFMKELNFSKQRMDEVVADMMSSDYLHAIKVFDHLFGDFVDLILPEGMNIHASSQVRS